MNAMGAPMDMQPGMAVEAITPVGHDLDTPSALGGISLIEVHVDFSVPTLPLGGEVLQDAPVIEELPTFEDPFALEETLSFEGGLLNPGEGLEAAPVAGRPEKQGVKELAALPHHGMTEAQRATLIRQLDVVGLPTRLTALVRLPNGRGQEDWMGAMTMGPEDGGKLIIFEHIEKGGNRAVADVLTHESMHNLSPFVEGNDAAYGSREARLEVAATIQHLGDRTFDTGIYMNGYHKLLAEQAALPADHTDHISKDVYYEEVSAIFGQLRLTGNEAHIAQVEESLNRKADGKAEKMVNLISKEVRTQDGFEMEMTPMDKAYAYMVGAEDHAALEAHIANIVEEFSDQPNFLTEARHIMDEAGIQLEMAQARLIKLGGIVRLSDDEFAIA